jgi:flagellar protein FliO/FliZ
MMRALPLALLGASGSASAAAAPGVSLGDLSSVVLSLLLVVGFILAAAWVVRRMPLGAARGNGALKVLAALPLGPRERLLLVAARDREILIAVSPAGVFNVGTAGGPQTGETETIPEPEFTLTEQS